MSNQIDMFSFTDPEMPKFSMDRCSVRKINYQTASRICNNYHYAKRTPSIVASFGLYVDKVLGGIITYGIPPNRNALGFCGEEYISNALELNRLFVFDWCGRNSESFLIGQSFKLLEKHYPKYFLLVSYADPSEGHQGYIYQATNWIYTGVGLSTGGDVLVNGIRKHNKDVYNLYGTNDKEKLAKLGVTIEKITKEGKHRYVYFLGDCRQRRKMRKLLKWEVLPYPKEKQDMEK